MEKTQTTGQMCIFINIYIYIGRNDVYIFPDAKGGSLLFLLHEQFKMEMKVTVHSRMAGTSYTVPCFKQHLGMSFVTSRSCRPSCIIA